jgi:hypothetical protein
VPSSMPENAGSAEHPRVATAQGEGVDAPGGAGQADIASDSGSGLGYEKRDANTVGVLAFLAALAIVIAFVFLFTWGLFRQYTVSDQNGGPASSFANVREVPPGPVLQVRPEEDLEHLLARQTQMLETYGWENRQAGTVRIPIEQAMDLLLQKGLPAANAGSSGAGSGAAAKESQGETTREQSAQSALPPARGTAGGLKGK